jgi:hypothetical protein
MGPVRILKNMALIKTFSPKREYKTVGFAGIANYFEGD